MNSFIRYFTLSFCLLAFTVASQAAVAVVNSASFTDSTLPNGGIAQGSIFTGFGAGLGPVALATPTPWPFPTELAGTSIKVTVGGTTVDCFMVFTSAGQVAAILPSNTPIGEGTITVRFNGLVADTGPITVVASSFGIFTLNQQGIGPAVATDPLGGVTPYSFIDSAAPGDFVDIWGTGLGATSAPDEGAPTTENLAAQVKLVVAGVEVPVQYAGRSGCCSGVDIVRFIVPENLAGCFLPVTVVVNGNPSNFGSIPVAADGGVCSSDALFGLPDFSQLQDGSSFRNGAISLGRTRQSSS